jgi:hypothetical protein
MTGQANPGSIPQRVWGAVWFTEPGPPVPVSHAVARIDCPRKR